ncbi:Kef-type K+ transport system membrane component KefB [Algoriphagus sp. 4150]|uniref:cation:proton antiporter n=1 Tax=Algoriphagus sp. 4150 TaxID=2817756 RepID=UPI00285429D4|nr:cation:proton antiporter [Algoriphagus sp. 4150]MDR7129725.1 Kef-type K+ transport system membrane component KefB [Algoriphagus sp. 4150]
MNKLSLIAEQPFFEFAIILALAALFGIIGKVLKQPLIVMFIALGIVMGPAVLDIVKSKENIHLLAEIGISVLLFIVGLKLDLRIIKSVGKIALLTGIGQVLFTSIFGYLIGLALGFTSLHSFYIAIALTFSSTIIIVKLLSDKKEIDSLHGQIAIGFLIVQDIVVILMMIVLSAIQKGGETSLNQDITRTLVAGGGLIGFTFIAMRWILPKLTNYLAQSQELLTLFSVAWAVALAAIGEYIGFSGEVGAFLAGVTLASSEFKEAISSRLVSLRDFLLLFFFVSLGTNLDLTAISGQITPALYFSFFVLVGNPIIVLIIMGVMGYKKRTSFLAGLTVAQISEFSLIFAGLGLAVGHINKEIVGLITLVGLITIGLSTYLILYSHQIFNFLSPFLSIFQRKNTLVEQENTNLDRLDYNIIIIGLGRFGNTLADMLDQHTQITYLGIDFSPSIVKEWRKKNRAIVYGDIDDPELLENIPYQNTNIIISTVHEISQSKQLVNDLKRRQYKGKVFVTALTDKENKELLAMGIENVLLPHSMAAANFFNTYLKYKVT